MAQGEVSTRIAIGEKCVMGMGSLKDALQFQCRAADVELVKGGDDDVVGNDNDGSEFKGDVANGELLYQKNGVSDEEMGVVSGDIATVSVTLDLQSFSENGVTVEVLLDDSLQGNTAKSEIFEASGSQAESVGEKVADENGNGNIEDPEVESLKMKELRILETDKSTREVEAMEYYDEADMADQVSDLEGKVDVIKPDDSGGYAVNQDQTVEESTCEVGIPEADVLASSTLLDVVSDSCPNSDNESSLEKVVSSSPHVAIQQFDDIAVSMSNENLLKEIDSTKPAVGTDCSVESIANLVVAEENVEFEEVPVHHGSGDVEGFEEKEEGSGVHGNGDCCQYSEESVEIEEKKGSSVFHGSGDVALSYEEPVEVPEKEEEVSLFHDNGALNKDGVSCETSEFKLDTEFPVLCPWIPDSSYHAPQTEVPRSYLKAFVKGSKPRVTTNHLMAGSAFFNPNPKNYQADDEQSLEISASVSPATSDSIVEPKIPIQDISSSSDSEKASEVAMEALDSLPCNRESNDNLKMEDAEEKMIFQVTEETQTHHRDSVSEDSNKDVVYSEARTEIKTMPFNFLVRIPRCDDESLREQIRLAKIQVDEKTKCRDEIQTNIKQKKANLQILLTDCEEAKREASNAKNSLRLKRREIESLDHVCNKARNAGSIENIDTQVHSLENRIQHETLPLKEEKRLIHEIKKLNQLREQMSSDLGSRNEVKQVLEQSGEVEEQIKVLRKELDVLKDNVLKTEGSAVEAGAKYENGRREVQELQSQFRDADRVRQAAYIHWQCLKKDLSNKNKLFFKYKDNLTDANNHAFSGNLESVHEVCSDQVKTFMEMWNTNNDFREEYSRLNARSPLKRFGTLDCRSMGPDEKKPTTIANIADDEVVTISPTPVDPQVSIDQRSEMPVSDSNHETTSVNVKSTEQEPKQEFPNVAASAKGSDEVHEISREEAEVLRKAEEKRKKETEANLKEQRRLEEIAKANEARERKKKQSEKQQSRAKFRLQKEAEEKEKKQEKRHRKKERKNATSTCNNNINNDNNSETISNSEASAELTKEQEMKDSSVTVPKKRMMSKQTKTKSLPPSLRNRNKKSWHQWVTLLVVIGLCLLILLLMGNNGEFSFSSLNSKR